MFGLIEELKKDKKEKSAVVEFIDERAAGAAAIIGAATGLTPKESKAFIQNNKKTEEVADKVAIAQDLENISRTQQLDGLTATKKTETARSAQAKPKLDLNTK